MLYKNNFLMIGATGRNTGKTEFACRVIARYAPAHPVIGVKVTAIDKNEVGCPRGKSSCGVCDSLEGDFEIITETDPAPKKDTSRMLAAGAAAVLWLKVDKMKLDRGAEALMKLIPENAMVVCESNSFRHALEPGLFLVIKNKQEKTIKESCLKVIEYANKILTFDQAGWDYFPERIQFINNQWILRQKATAVVLAGGKSSRMGGMDKSLLPVNGIPLIQYITSQLHDHFDEIIIGANDPEKYSFLNYKIVPDIEKDKGPLMGIMSCLKASSNDVNFVTACDIPEMNLRLIGNMINLASNTDIVIPVGIGNKHEPLYAVYKKSIVESAAKILDGGGRRIIELLNHRDHQFIDFNDSNWYLNLNDEEDYKKYIVLQKHRKC